MKITTFFVAALFASAVANAQTDTTSLPVADTAVVTLIDTSVGKAYVTNPEKLKDLTSESLTASHIFPALGTYKGNGTSTDEVTIVLDEANKGIVWVEGLPQGRFKALMKKAPSTYKIPAQKSAEGKAIAEGSLYVDPETNELTIVLGKSFDDQNPTSFLNVSNTKKTGWKYTGIKADAEVAPVTPTTQQ